MSSAKVLKAEFVKVSALKPHERNYIKHGEDQLEHIIASMKANGFYRNVVVAVDNTILAGHGAVEAAKKLKLDKIPVVRLNLKPNDKRALKVLTGDNEVTKLGEVNDRSLSEILKDIAVDTDLLGTGFDKQMLANLVYVTRHQDEIKDFDAAKEWVGLPKYDDADEEQSKEPILVITFKTAKDRDKFVKEKEIKIRDKRGDRKWSTIWPFKERNDLKSVKFEDAET